MSRSPRQALLRTALAAGAFACAISTLGAPVAAAAVEARPAPRAFIADVDCATGSATITFANDGGGTAALRLVVDGATIETLPVDAGASTTRTVPVAPGATAAITVSGAGLATVTRSVRNACGGSDGAQGAAALAAELSDLDCGIGGVVALLGNSGSEPARFSVLRDGEAIATVTVAPSASQSQFVAIREDSAARVEVRADGMQPVSREYERNCSTATAGSDTGPTSALVPSANANGTDGGGLAPDGTPLVTGSGAAVAGAAAVPAPPAEALPFTGARSTLLLAVLGIGAIGSGVLLHVRGVRRVTDRRSATRACAT